MHLTIAMQQITIARTAHQRTAHQKTVLQKVVHQRIAHLKTVLQTAQIADSYFFNW